MSGKLYIVATPIGNLEDISLRALKTLKEVDLITAEDTRHTLKLLNHFEISKPLISYHRHSEAVKTKEIIQKLEEGKNIALVSDAGTPTISDPGEELVKECIESNIEVVPIPGACALITALTVSGLNTKEFSFIGFLPLNKKMRKEKLLELEESKKTIILYEAPHKLQATLEDLKEILGERQIVLAKELTKIHETIIRGSIEEILQKDVNVCGEYVILIEGIKINEDETERFLSMSLEEHYKLYEKQGYEKKDIIKKIAKDRKVTKNEIYKFFC